MLLRKDQEQLFLVSSSSSSSLVGTISLKLLILALLSNSYFFGTLNFVHGFNIDLPSVLTHRGSPGSMFGFSVAQHRDSNVSWILVGAPAADSRQPGVTKGGGVYRCSCVTSDTCQLIPFDRTGNNQVDGRQIDEKSGQWFGATVKSSGDDGIILACAPRYTWFSANKKRRDPVGTCFIAKDSFTEFTEYSPCRTPRWGYHRQGSCQLGLGADVDAAGRRTFLGAVGSWYWQGQIFMVDSRKSAGGDQSKVPFYQFIPPGQLYSQSVSSRPDIRWTREGPSWDDDSYLGYSVATGEFSGDGDSDVVVGMPRGNNLTGRVVIYSSELTNLHNISGEQIGAYFAYCLAVLDVDGDGLDDLVVGAPMYTDFQDPAMKIETGRVYIIYQNKLRKFADWDSIDGIVNKGRFGLSLTTLGDINRDGFDDFAVGAPYGGEDGNGAVYIYQGTKEHIATKREYTQVIYSSALTHQVSTFGFSLAGGRDLDGNGYSDLIVGAYDSDVIAYFRSRPVVQVRSKLSYTVGKQINLDEKRCVLADRQTRVTCFNMTLCMSYDGFETDDIIDFNVQTILDSKKLNEHRLFFMDYENAHVINRTLQLRKSQERCIPTRVYIKNGIRDKLTSLETDILYSMVDRRARHLSPVIDVTASRKEKAVVSIQKNCGPDNICIPDLRLKVAQSNKTFVFGSQQSIWLDIELYNNGEHSFESAVYVQVPPGLGYVSFDRLDTHKEFNVLCSPPKPETDNTIKCDMGNPLSTFGRAKVRLSFKPLVDADIKSNYEFTIVANSTNPENPNQLYDNHEALAIKIHVDTSIAIIGTSKHQPVIHNVSTYQHIEAKKNESHIGPEVIHVYEVKCGGPSRIEEATVDILWPSFTKDDEHYLYLLEQPDVDVVDPSFKTTASCEPVNAVNPLGLKIQRYLKTTISKTEIIRGGEGDGRREGNYSYSSNEVTFNGQDGTSGTYSKTSRTFSSTSMHTKTDSYGRGGGFGSEDEIKGTSVGRGATIYGQGSSTTYGGSGSTVHGSGGTTYGGGRSYESGSTTLSGSSSYDRTASGTGTSNGQHTFIPPSRPGSTSVTTSTRDETITHYGGSREGSSSRDQFNRNYDSRPTSRDEFNRNYDSRPTSSRDEYGTSLYGSRPTYDSGESEEDNNFLDYGNGGNGGRRGRRPQQDSRVLSRHQRDTSAIEKKYEEDIANSCPDVKCIRIRCHITSLPSDQSVFFTLRGRVYSDTFRKKFPGVNVNVTSKLLTRVTKLPYNVNPAFLGFKSSEVSTTIEESETIFKSKGIPWWLIVVAVLGGLIILMLLVLLLYLCGFFKRRRPHPGPEAQPLHRNGR